MAALKLVVEKTPEDHDSDTVYWENDKGEKFGYGYRGKDSGKIGLIKCPKCNRENYAPNVSTGVCSWCGFYAN